MLAGVQTSRLNKQGKMTKRKETETKEHQPSKQVVGRRETGRQLKKAGMKREAQSAGTWTTSHTEQTGEGKVTMRR